MPRSPDPLAQAKRIMAAMVKLPPKPHSEMKLGQRAVKPRAAKRKSK